jgi:hypothetical protein
LPSDAIAASGARAVHHHGNNGWGNGGGDRGPTARMTEAAEWMTAFRKETQCSPGVATWIGISPSFIVSLLWLALVAAALVALLFPSTPLKEVNRRP